MIAIIFILLIFFSSPTLSIKVSVVSVNGNAISISSKLGQRNSEIAIREMWRICKKGLILCEPSIKGANIYEKWRMKTLGYCENLIPTAKALPNSKILISKEGTYRYYPNTSHLIVIEKLSDD